MSLDALFSIGNATEWENYIIPQELSPEYVALGFGEWPLSAAATFRIAMWLTKEERHKLPGVRKCLWASDVALETPTLVGGQFDGDIEERLMLDAEAGAEHDDGFDDEN